MPASLPLNEAEWLTRKRRIDPRLDAAKWTFAPLSETPLNGPCRSEEQLTANGPAYYALWLDGHVVASVEAKRVSRDTRNVLSQVAYGALKGKRNRHRACARLPAQTPAFYDAPS
ncbi:MAG TPA: hypothetical protein PK156_51600 [Polyangium sp.]|nr:hypothetical protein [Polyangium sp.]